ncbi:hemagluttinin domain-containing protein [Stenotrophomonas maltophilia]|nr:hemagluttinin domain-containing protein [Stenotrophomonas maltophilia]MBA0249039.1 hemagluttinin domain-containing protein [Stenotrophomonas maltophilia]MBA0308758.1 hemagluttinin domain-containing protein [Stenotrophomonas maltophilia]MBA0440674.1 hemagluttinin domain-containing protein [Stenotrophomonas maltophilia]MBA0517542.1 hemagluttinin domain-containing protein [Stenotrophomonas maltophilia]
MNRIYRRLWNRVRQCWVVTSELGRAKGKPAQQGRVAPALVLLTLAGSVGASVDVERDRGDHVDWRDPMSLIGSPLALMSAVSPMATYRQLAIVNDPNYRDSTVSGDFSMILGSRSTATGKSSVVYGTLAILDGESSAAIGSHSTVRGSFSVGVGAGSYVNGWGSTSLGAYARTVGDNGVAIGRAAYVDTGAGVSGVAIGADSRAGTPGWTGAVAVGGEAQAGYDGVALGYASKANGAGALAMGSRANATSNDALAFGRNSRSSGAGATSLGGYASASGTGATAIGLNASATGEFAMAFGYESKANSTHTTSLGSRSSASGIGATAYGNSSYVSGRNGIAVGSGSRVDSGSSEGAIAIGGDSRAGANGYNGGIALGGKANASHDSVAIGYEAATRANNAVALGRGSIATEANTVSVGTSSAKRRVVNVEDARLSTTSTDAVTGKQLNSTNTNVTRAQTAADAAKTTATAAQSTANTANTNASTALAKANTVSGLVSQVSASGNVRLGGENTGTVLDVRNKSNAVRSIAGLKDGALSTSSTEAVTGKQLNATNANVTTAQTAADAAKTTATAAQTTATTANTNANTALAKANTVSGLVSQVSASGNVRLGGENTGTVLDARNKSNAVRSITGLKDGALSTSSTEAVTGKQLNATNSNVAAVKSTADAAQARVAVLDGLVGQVSASGNLRLGADNAGTVVDVANKSGAKRKLQNLANGVLSTSSTDAVTGQQLNATNSEVTSVRTAATAARTAADAARGVADGAMQKADVLGGLVGQVSANGNVRLGAENTGTIVDVANKGGGKRRIYNIANGTLSAGSTDAVTGQQLFATNTTVETQRQALAGHAQQLTDQDGRIADNRIELDALRADFDNFDPDLDGVVKFSADRHLVDMEGARVSGVAAGDISSAASTDAVNGGQLFATNVRVSELERNGRFLSVGYDDESIDADAGLFGVALGDSAKASLGSEGGVAIGSFAVAGAFNSVAIGRGAVVAEAAERGFALGVGSNVYAKEGVAFGALSRVVAGADGAVALGSYSIATEANTVSVGSGSVKRRLVNLDRGISDHDATTIAQLNEALAGLGGGAGLDAFGNVVGPAYSVQGGKQNNVGDALAALDGAVVRSDSRVDGLEVQLRATFQQSPSTRADGVGQLNLAGAQGMVLSNLADGRIAEGSRDAVTGSQLFEAKQDIARNRIHLEELKSRGFMEASDPAGVVDFGGSRLTGAAKGRIDGDSSDLVNGGQLHETNLRLSKVEADSAWLAVGADDQSRGAVAGALGVALGGDAVAGGTGATALGSYATAEATNSIALGRGAWVSESGFYGFAVGSGSRVNARFGVAIGAASQVLGGADGSVALGAESVADQVGTVSVGNDYLKRRIVNVANGRNTNDAATIGQLRGALSTLGGNIDANGNVTTPGFNVQGQHQSTINDALTTLDSAVVTTGSRMDRVETQLRSVFQETPSTRSDGTAQLTLAGANGMVISNVANGLIAAGSREAVNGGQLHAVQQQLNGRMDGLEQRVDGQPQSRAVATASAAPTEQVTSTPEASDSPQMASAGEGMSPAPQPKSKKDDTPSPTPQVDTAELEKMLARANEYTDGAISNFERRLDKMDKRFNRMAAMSSAQTAMAMNTAGLATYNRLGAGVGYAEGESAMAVGYQRVLNEKGSATFSLNGAFTNSGERSMGVGVGIGW